MQVGIYVYIQSSVMQGIHGIGLSEYETKREWTDKATAYPKCCSLLLSVQMYSTREGWLYFIFSLPSNLSQCYKSIIHQVTDTYIRYSGRTERYVHLHLLYTYENCASICYTTCTTPTTLRQDGDFSTACMDLKLQQHACTIQISHIAYCVDSCTTAHHDTDRAAAMRTKVWLAQACPDHRVKHMHNKHTHVHVSQLRMHVHMIHICILNLHFQLLHVLHNSSH